MSKQTKEIKLTPLYYDYVLGAKYDAVIEIGGRYSGKSYNSQIEEAANLASKQDYKLLIIQDLDKGGSDGYYAGLVDKIAQFEHTPAYNITTSSTKITNTINGNSVLFRGYKTDQQKKDVKNIDQVTKIIVEEGEWMTFDDFLALIQQLRGKVQEDRRLDILLNPVNEYCFVNTEIIQTPSTRVLEYFPNSKRPKVFEKVITTNYMDGDTEKHISINLLVVISTHHDNPHLTGVQRAAIEVYKTTDPDKYKQLAEAKFTKSGGVYFKEFQREIHVCEPFQIPSHWRRYFVMDYGLDMLAGYWVAQDDHNKAYFYKEEYEPDLIISAAAKKIKSLTTKDEKIYEYLAPPDLWNRRQETGASAMELFSDNGIRLTKANNDRVQGWLNVKEWLAPYEDEQGILTAGLQIFSNCTNLIRCLSQIKADPKDANDVAKEPHELTHAPDALRYYCAGRPTPYKAPVAHTKVNNFWTMQQQDEGGLQQW